MSIKELYTLNIMYFDPICGHENPPSSKTFDQSVDVVIQPEGSNTTQPQDSKTDQPEELSSTPILAEVQPPYELSKEKYVSPLILGSSLGAAGAASALTLILTKVVASAKKSRAKRKGKKCCSTCGATDDFDKAET